MTLLHEAVDFKKFDTRVLERNQDRGVLNPKEVEKSLKDLPDDGANAEWISVDQLAGQTDNS